MASGAAMTAQSFPIPDNLEQLPPRELERYFLLLSPDQLQAFPRESLTTSNIVGAYRRALERQVQLNPLPPPLAAPTPPITGPATPLPPGGAPLPDNAMQLIDTLNAGATGQPGAVQRQQQPTQAIGGPAIEAPAAPTVPGVSINLAPIPPQGPQAQTDTGILSPTLVQAERPPPPPGYRLQTERPPPPPGYRLQTERPPPPPGYRLQTERPPPPPGYRLQTERPPPVGEPWRSRVDPDPSAHDTAPRQQSQVVGHEQWFGEMFGPEATQNKDYGAMEAMRWAIDPDGARAVELERQRAMEARGFYEPERDARPGIQQVGDWVRSFLTGMTFRGWDEFLGFVDGAIATIRGGDFQAVREMRVEMERRAQREFEAANPVGAVVTEIAGAIVTAAIPAKWAAQGIGKAKQFGRGLAAGAGEGFAYGFNAAEGGFSDRIPSAALTAIVTGAAAGLIPLAAPLFARSTSYFYNKVRHPIAGAPSTDAAQRVAATREFLPDNIPGGQGPLTRGQATQNPIQLAVEASMRQGGEGQYAQTALTNAFSSQNEAVRRAAERIGLQLSSTEGAMITARELGEQVTSRLARIAQEAKDTAQRFYRSAEELNPTLSPTSAETVPQRVAWHMGTDHADFMLDQAVHPTVFRMTAEIDRLPEIARFANEGVVPFREIMAMRRRLNNMIGDAATDGDRAASRRVIDSFDRAIDGLVEDQMFEGSTQAIAMLREGNEYYAQFRQLTRPRSGDASGRFIANIIEGNKNADQVGAWLISSNLARPTGQSISAATRLKEVLGAGSNEWNAVRGAAFLRSLSRADDIDQMLTPKQIAENLKGFTDGRGSGLATTLFTVEERDLMRRLANTLRLVDSGTGRAQGPNAMTKLKRSVTNLGRVLLAGFGFVVSGAQAWAIPAVFFGQLAMTGAVGAASRYAAVRRALNPNASMPMFSNPDSATRALSAVLGTGALVVTPRAVD